MTDLKQRINAGGQYHTWAVRGLSFGLYCKFVPFSLYCPYHRDAAKTYWALAMLHDNHPDIVQKTLDCIDWTEETQDYNTRFMDDLSDCLKRS